jgi:hypothetical protein
MRRIRGRAAAIFLGIYIVVVNWVWPLAQRLLGDAVVNWINGQIADFFHLQPPTAAEAVAFAWGYVVPLVLLAGLFWLYHELHGARGPAVRDDKFQRSLYVGRFEVDAKKLASDLFVEN